MSHTMFPRRPPWYRRLSVLDLILIAATGVLGSVAVAIGVAAGFAPTTTVYRTAPPAVATVTPPHTSCGWYSGNLASQVIVTLTGASRADCDRISTMIADDTHATWVSTGFVAGAVVAQMDKGGVTLRIYQTGSENGFTPESGYLADDLQASGWTVVPVS